MASRTEETEQEEEDVAYAGDDLELHIVVSGRAWHADSLKPLAVEWGFHGFALV